MNPKIYWKEEMEAALIDLVKEKPNLWDPRNKYYIRKSIRNESYKEIGENLKARWPDHAQLFTHENLMNKFAILRSNFRREWKTAQKVRSKPETADFVPDWEHYVRLSFLERVPIRNARHSVTVSTPMDVSDNSDDSDISGEHPGPSGPKSGLEIELFPIRDEREDEHVQPKKFKFCQSSDDSSTEDSVSFVQQYFKDVVYRREQVGEVPLSAADLHRKQVLDLAFCRYLNTMLSPIPDCLQKELAKIKITETILKLKFPAQFM